ncbi:MAG: hypothetical protein ACRDUS_20540 [Mycobacterium sp.]
MSLLMSPGKYRQLADALGPAVDRSHLMPYPIAVTQNSGDETVALYIVENARGRACYGGQTAPAGRLPGAAARRLRQHLRERPKARSWSRYWVIPIQEGVDDGTLNELERALNARIGVPLRRKRPLR